MYFEDNEIIDCVDAMRQNAENWNSGFEPAYTLDGETESSEDNDEWENTIPFMEWDVDPLND